MLGNTPMMKQYQTIKQELPDTILFYRLGDFYEMFGPDAELASRELNITLTGRDAGLKERIPMCGVPCHAAESYVAKLIQKGFKVAICEQVEDPKEAKGIVRREVVRIITPGTALDNLSLTVPASNYLASITGNEAGLGLAVCETSTGDFWVSQFTGTDQLKTLKDELTRLKPAEVLVPAGAAFNPVHLFANQEKPLLTYYDPKAFAYHLAHKTLREHFPPDSLRTFAGSDYAPAVCAAGAILQYLTETQKAPPRQIKELKYVSLQNYMTLDATTFRNLEITRTIRFHDKKGSLLDIIDKTKTSLGSRLLQRWLERPLLDLKVLEERLSAVEALSQDWAKRQALRSALAEVYDLERLLTRILYGRANPKELLSFRQSLSVLPQLKNILHSFAGSHLLNTLLKSFDTLEDVYALLEKALEENPPYNLKEGGVIKSGYNPTIDQLREVSTNGKEWIARLETEEKEKTGIKSLKVGFNKVFGYYFEVTKANLASVPGYFQRKQTLANGERYITEELKNLENQVLGAEERLLALEEECYHNLLKEIGNSAGRIQNTAEILAHIDALQSLAEVAVQNGYGRPLLLEKEKNHLEFEELRHPVVEKVLKDTLYIPNNLHMPEAVNLYIITGPNMGGKSTYCRSVALAVILGQIGSFVPAKKAVFSLRDRVFARVGASDDLSSGQSTFMVEMNEVANILSHATRHSLVILDEVGRGTSTYDGLSMAWAVSEHLVQKVAAKTLFATHYHELTQLANMEPSVHNLSVAVRERGEEIIFLHQIMPGAADKSYGIQVGRLAGLPDSVIQRAKQILKLLEHDNFNRQILEQENTLSQDDPLPQPELSPMEREVLDTLVKTNVLNLTPLEALNYLYQLQQKLNKEQRNIAAK
ncbi:MAG: DNA mismatch repair protein MutS [Bacillota bacterium]